MAKIPEATRRQFVSGVIRPQGGVNLGAIDAAGAGARAVVQGANTVAQVLRQKQARQEVAEGSEFNSRADIQYHDAFNQLSRREDIIKNPSLIRDEIPKIGAELMKSEQFLSQPPETQNLMRKNITRLNTQFGIRGLEYENKQTFENTNIAMNRTLDNFDLEALTTDEPMDNMLQRYTATVAANVKSGALTEQQGELQTRAGAASITENRVQQLINNDELDEANAMLGQEATQDILGADGLQRAQAKVASRVETRLKQAAKIEKARLSDPWGFINMVDTDPVPQIAFQGDAKQAANSLDDRVNFVKAKNAQYATDLPLLTDTETQGFIQLYQRLPPNEGAKTLNDFTKTLPDDQQGLIADAIFQKNKPMGIAVSVADGAPDVTRGLLNGADVIAKKLIKMPSDFDIKAQVNKEIGSVIVDPQMMAALQEGVRNLYADSIHADNDNSGSKDDTIIKKALDSLVGPQFELNGSATIGFRKDDGKLTDEDEFTSLYRDLTLGVIEEIQGDVPRYADGTPVDIDDLREQGELVVAKEGQYMIKFSDAFLVDGSGTKRPFVLDMKDISTKLRRFGISQIHPEGTFMDNVFKSMIGAIPGVTP